MINYSNLISLENDDIINISSEDDDLDINAGKNRKKSNDFAGIYISILVKTNF